MGAVPRVHENGGDMLVMPGKPLRGKFDARFVAFQ
jgi:hypothetical protein